MKRLLTIALTMLAAAVGGAQELTLDSCLALARRNNPALQQARLEVERAAEVRRQARTAFFPQLSAQAAAFDSYKPLLRYGIDDVSDADLRQALNELYDRFGDRAGIERELTLIENGAAASVSAVQPLFAGGRIVAGNRLAEVAEEAAALQAEVAGRELEWQVEQAYWLCVSLEMKQGVVAQMQQLLDTLKSTVATAVASGVATEVDRLRLQLKCDEVDAQSLRLDNGLALARRALAAAMGVDYSDGMVLAEKASEAPLPLLDEAADSLLAARPEVQLLELGVEAERLRARMALAEALPQVVVGAGWGWSRLMLWDDHEHTGGNGMVWGGVQLPISGWWQASHKVKEHRIAMQQAQLQRDDKSRQMALQQRQARTAVAEAEATLRQSKRSVEQAQRVLNLAMLGYRTGMQTISEVLEAQTLYAEALGRQNDALVERISAWHRYRALTAR